MQMQKLYSQILQRIDRGQSAALCTCIVGEEGLVREGITRTLGEVTPVLDAKGQRCVRATMEKNEVGERIVHEPVLPPERLILLGGGHVALALCEAAAKCGFAVYVADDRPAFANAARFPWAKEVVCDAFESAIARFQITPYDYVAVLTRGHTHDGDCLRAILSNGTGGSGVQPAYLGGSGVQPAYLGMIGSRRRVRGLLDQLLEEGYPKEKIDRICSPIGLAIGAVTPEEISISILAELIAYKRLPEHSGEGPRCCNESDLEPEMIRYLAENHEPKAVVTVLATRGSTPRGPGAKMAVDPRGRITGTIGGGCGEAVVLRDAMDLIGTGRYKVVEIDMTGDVAAAEGMVCGGTMEVLIEDGTEPAQSTGGQNDE
jgi:xanthine dehydrogenase accessory factor